MTKSEQLRQRIKDELGLDPIGEFKTLRSGYYQKSTGAMSWITIVEDEEQQVGSAFTVTELLRAKKIAILDPGAFCEIQPVDGAGRTDYTVLQ